MSKAPPKYLLRFFRWFCHPDYVEDIEGDLLERFEKRQSRWLFALEVLKLLRPSLIKPTSGGQKLNYYGMFKHNLKITYRNLWRKKSYAIINIGGLVLGLSIVMLISLWIQDELSFNTQNDYYNRTARVMQKQTLNGKILSASAMPFPLYLELDKQYGDDFDAIVPATWFGDYNLSNNEIEITTRGGFAGKDAPELMSLEMIEGNRKGLTEATSILISQSVAKALFGDNEPIGKTITVHNQVDLNVTGVFKDISRKSSFHNVTFIGNWDFYVAIMDWIDKTAWDNNSFQLFAILDENANMKVVSEKITRIKYDQTPPEKRIYDTKVFLHPMKDWHLRSNWENGVQKGGAIKYVWWFGIIGSFVLLLACVNFMNLSTAQSIRRAKEIGVRKAIGTRRAQLAIQFLTESILIAFIAFFLAGAISFFALPYFNYLSDKEITIPFYSMSYWGVGIGFAIIAGLISGSYPAVYLSSFNTIQALKGSARTALSVIFLRKSLVVFQFTVSVALIIATLVIIQQIDYASQRPLGYDSNGIISIEMTSPEHYSKSQVFKSEVLASGAVSHFTQASAPLTEVWNQKDDLSWEGMEADFTPMFCTFFVNHSYGKTIYWEILQGRDFSADYSSDSTAIIINESAVKYMQLDDPLNKNIKWFKDFKIIGVVKDLLVESPFSEVKPSVYVINPGDLINFMILRLNPNIPTMEALIKVEDVFEQHMAKVPFNYSFVSDVHKRKFREINRVASICQVFAVLAVLISCLGLFGLASFMVEQRTKEIGIRKVLGASALNLWKLLSKEYIGLVIISCIIAIPLAYYLLQNWLEAYEYRIEIGGWIFLIAFMGALLLTVLTVSFKSLKTALSNPAESLKDE